jgi:hypothetical protein
MCSCLRPTAQPSLMMSLAEAEAATVAAGRRAQVLPQLGTWRTCNFGFLAFHFVFGLLEEPCDLHVSLRRYLVLK